MNLRTSVLVAIGAVLVGGLLYVAFRTDPIPVDLHVVDRGLVQVTIDADGQTQIQDIYEVAAPISGTALRSPVEVGDRVVGGETIVAAVEPEAPSLLDARTRRQAEASVAEAEAALNVALSDLRRAEEELVFAQSQFDRTQALVGRGVASVTALETDTQRLAIALAAVEAARARIEMSEGVLERNRAALIEPTTPGEAAGACCVELRAPVDGVVLSIATISERPVVAGAPLMSIGDPSELELVADLLSSDAVRVGPGTRAMVERWGGDGVLEAKLLRIEPAAQTKVSALGIEEQRVDVIFDLVSPIEDRPGLGEGFSVFLRVVEWEDPDALRVPLSAVFRRGADWTVFVEEGGVARERMVELGRRDGRFAVVLDGLEEGETVVTHPSDGVASGTAVIARDAL